MKILGNEKLREISIILLIIASIAATILAIMVHYHAIFGLDVYLSRDIQAEGTNSNSLLFKYLYFVSLFGRPAISTLVVLIASLIFWLYRYYHETIFALLSTISAAINFILKLIVNRPRPSENFVQVIDRQLSPSFPSGHVVFYTVFFGYLIVAMYFTKKIPLFARLIISLFSLMLVVAVSFSRIYLGAHWLTDIIGGYLVGLVLLAVLLHFYLKPKIKKS